MQKRILSRTIFVCILLISITACSDDKTKRQQLRRDPLYYEYTMWVKYQGSRYDHCQNPVPTFTEWKYLKSKKYLEK